MYTLDLGLFMYRHDINDLPVAFKDYFTKLSEINNYKTRHINGLQINIIRNPFQIKVLEQIVPFFGILYQKTLKESTSVKHFRTQFKRHLFKTYISFHKYP